MPPRILPANIDWAAARGELNRLVTSDAAGDKPADTPATDINDVLLGKLNAAAGTAYKDISASSVPVLLPVDTGALLHSSAENPAQLTGDAANFRPHFFMAGPAGYDVVFTLHGAVTDEIPDFSRKEDPVLLLSGFAMVYDLPPPVAQPYRPSPELQGIIPGLRKRWLESYSRYSFERYGVTYTVSMLCSDGRPRGRWVACRDADRIMVRFIKTLQLAGGTPATIPQVAPQTVQRPVAQSPDFTFAPPGKLIRNTGFRGNDGRSDYTVYAKIRFPLAQAPAYANSQAFMNWGNCDFTGRVGFKPRKGTPYRCKVNDKPLVFDESAPENRAYPWRDNFCEHRRYFVGQCPGGEGHQGQDIRPVTCKLLNEGADRCQPFLDDVVAVRDGMILRVPSRESLYLLVNRPGEHIRFRYLHMAPGMLDAGGMTSGRLVHEGEIIGKAGNFDRIPNGTSYHVHFEVQVPSRDGWVFVSPYATLVTAYERLIGGRGREVRDPEVVPQAEVKPPAPPATADKPAATAEAKTDKPVLKPGAALRPLATGHARSRRAMNRVAESVKEARKTVEAKQSEPHKTAGKKNTREAKRDTERKSRHAERNGTPIIAAPESKAQVSDRHGSHDGKSRHAKSRVAKSRVRADGVRNLGNAAPAASAGAGYIGVNVQ